MSKTVLEELMEARALIAKGWVQGTMAAQTGNPWDGFRFTAYCMLGALEKVHGAAVAWRKMDNPHYEPVVHALGMGLPANYCGVEDPARFIVSFNDSTGRTQQEVLDVFDRAIAIELQKTAPSPAQQVMLRAQDTDLIQHEETDHGFRPIRPDSLFKLSKFDSTQINFTDLLSAWDRRKSGSARRESEGVAG